VNRRRREALSEHVARERSGSSVEAGGPTSRSQFGMVDSGDTTKNGPRRLAEPYNQARRPTCKVGSRTEEKADVTRPHARHHHRFYLALCILLKGENQCWGC
jgi:hypothetical protein